MRVNLKCQDLRVWMRCEAQPRSEARRTNLYVERAPEVATSCFSKIFRGNWTVLISSKNLRKISTKQIAKRVSPEYIQSRSGFSLAELMVASVFLIFALMAVILGYLKCMELNDLSRNSSFAIKAVKSRMETIKNTAFNQLVPTYHNVTFTVNNLTGQGVSYVDSSDPILYKISVVYCWRQKSGRVIGEDKDLDGVLDAGEDLNGDGRISSIVELVNYVYN